ncbi:MAG: NAD(P)/FAD-dependent oxidoreductase [Cellvibrionaceae bacterium]
MINSTYIIIGASHAAAQLCLSLRQEGFTGKITVVGNEDYLPYQHPPLSKQFLSGDITIDDLDIRPKALYEKHNIEFILNTHVISIDTKNKSILTNNAEHLFIQYDKLALCTGARAREIPITGADLPNVHYLRTLTDIHSIQVSIENTTKIKSSKKTHAVIIGGGYIGLETAAMLRKMNINVTILEAAPRILGRVTAPEVSSFYHQLHEKHGVKILTDCKIISLTENEKNDCLSINLDKNNNLNLDKKNFVGKENTVEKVSIDADFIIVGIGVLPNTELAQSAGLKINNGIVVDEFAHTSHKDIVAAGDCTIHPSKRYGLIRLESVPNAIEQAKTAAATLCGKQKPHLGLPWFWSDQYDYKLQIAGLSTGYDKVIVRGDNTLKDGELSSFVIYYLTADKLIAADCVNRPKEFMLARQWLQKDHTPDLENLKNDNYEMSRND